MSIWNYFKNILVFREIEIIVDKILKLVGSFGYDLWGYNIDVVKIVLSVMCFVFEDYFRVEVYGLENIFVNGCLLLIVNYGGQFFIDGSLVVYVLVINQYVFWVVCVMVECWLLILLFVGNIFNEMGVVIGDFDNCVRML